MKEYFDLDPSALREAAKWALPSVEAAVALFESRAPADPRPRRALEGMAGYVADGKRGNGLRKLAMDAYRASRDSEGAAAFAANAASLGAAMAFTHPFRDERQAVHLLGPVAYAALAAETGSGDAGTGDAEIARALDSAPVGVARLLAEYPERGNGKGPLERLLLALDRGLREKAGENGG